MAAPAGSRSPRATRSTSPHACRRLRPRARSCSATSRAGWPGRSSARSRWSRSGSPATARGAGVATARPPARGGVGTGRCRPRRSSAASAGARPAPQRARGRGRAERTCRLVTVTRRAGDRQVAARARARRRDCGRGDRRSSGRCPPYGEGSTFTPARRDRPRGWRARTPSRRVVRSGRRRAGGAIAAKMLAAIGLRDEPVKPEETAWAVRRLLERVARAAAARGRRRGHPMGRADAARPGRARRRLLERRADPAAVPRAARAAGDAPGVGGAARRPRRSSCSTACPRRGAPARRRGRRGRARAERREQDRRDRGRQPALPRAARRRARRAARGGRCR